MAYRFKHNKYLLQTFSYYYHPAEYVQRIIRFISLKWAGAVYGADKDHSPSGVQSARCSTSIDWWRCLSCKRCSLFRSPLSLLLGIFSRLTDGLSFCFVLPYLSCIRYSWFFISGRYFVSPCRWDEVGKEQDHQHTRRTTDAQTPFLLSNS